MAEQIKFQIGKNGITPGVIEALSLIFKNHKQVRISLLKASGRDRDSIESMALELSQKLSTSPEHKGYSFNHKIIGFTIILSIYSPHSKR